MEVPVILLDDSEDEAPAAPPAPRPVLAAINLVSDDDGDEENPAQMGGPSLVALGTRKATGRPPTPSEVDSDDECMEVCAPARDMRGVDDAHGGAASSRPRLPAEAGPGGAATGQDADDDVVFEGRTGDLALADFPTPVRTAPSSASPPTRSASVNCFCYVCDAPASGCPSGPSTAARRTSSWRGGRRARRGRPAHMRRPRLRGTPRRTRISPMSSCSRRSSRSTLARSPARPACSRAST